MTEEKTQHKHEEKKIEEQKKEMKKDNVEEKKVEHAKTEVKKEEKKIVKKEFAMAQGLNLHASKKHLMYISNFIKGKKIDVAIKELGEVIKLRRAIPFKGEIPHRKGMMSGRYPVSASELMINVLKGLKGNVIVNGLDLEKTRINYASVNWASRPARSGGRRAKRAQVLLKAAEIKGEKK